MILELPEDRTFPMSLGTLWAWLPLRRRKRRTWVRQRIQVRGSDIDTDETKWPILGLGYFSNNTGWGERESSVARKGMSVRGTSHRNTNVLDLYIYIADGRTKVSTGITLEDGAEAVLVYCLDAGIWPLKKGRVMVWVDGEKVADEPKWFHIRPAVWGYNRWSPTPDRPHATITVTDQVIATRKKDVFS